MQGLLHLPGACSRKTIDAWKDINLSTDAQNHHKKHLCPKCGELMDFRREERKELFCSKCGLVDTFRFDAAKILFGIQSHRRREKGSIGKKILAEYIK
jgi:ribosomal protein L37AE/L43A